MPVNSGDITNLRLQLLEQGEWLACYDRHIQKKLANEIGANLKEIQLIADRSLLTSQLNNTSQQQRDFRLVSEFLPKQIENLEKLTLAEVASSAGDELATRNAETKSKGRLTVINIYRSLAKQIKQVSQEIMQNLEEKNRLFDPENTIPEAELKTKLQAIIDKNTALLSQLKQIHSQVGQFNEECESAIKQHKQVKAKAETQNRAAENLMQEEHPLIKHIYRNSVLFYAKSKCTAPRILKWQRWNDAEQKMLENAAPEDFVRDRIAPEWKDHIELKRAKIADMSILIRDGYRFSYLPNEVFVKENPQLAHFFKESDSGQLILDIDYCKDIDTGEFSKERFEQACVARGLTVVIKPMETIHRRARELDPSLVHLSAGPIEIAQDIEVIEKRVDKIQAQLSEEFEQLTDLNAYSSPADAAKVDANIGYQEATPEERKKAKVKQAALYIVEEFVYSTAHLNPQVKDSEIKNPLIDTYAAEVARALDISQGSDEFRSLKAQITQQVDQLAEQPEYVDAGIWHDLDVIANFIVCDMSDAKLAGSSVDEAKLKGIQKGVDMLAKSYGIEAAPQIKAELEELVPRKLKQFEKLATAVAIDNLTEKNSQQAQVESSHSQRLARAIRLFSNTTQETSKIIKEIMAKTSAHKELQLTKALQNGVSEILNEPSTIQEIAEEIAKTNGLNSSEPIGKLASILTTMAEQAFISQQAKVIAEQFALDKPEDPEVFIAHAANVASIRLQEDIDTPSLTQEQVKGKFIDAIKQQIAISKAIEKGIQQIKLDNAQDNTPIEVLTGSLIKELSLQFSDVEDIATQVTKAVAKTLGTEIDLTSSLSSITPPDSAAPVNQSQSELGESRPATAVHKKQQAGRPATARHQVSLVEDDDIEQRIEKIKEAKAKIKAISSPPEEPKKAPTVN